MLLWLLVDVEEIVQYFVCILSFFRLYSMTSYAFKDSEECVRIYLLSVSSTFVASFCPVMPGGVWVLHVWL